MDGTERKLAVIESQLNRLEKMLCDFIYISECRARGKDPKQEVKTEWLRLMQHCDVLTSENVNTTDYEDM